MFLNIKHSVFWLPFLLFIGAAVLSMLHKEFFVRVTTAGNDWVISNVGWLFSIAALLMVFACVSVYFSRLGEVRIGGPDAEPLLGFFSWFAITLTTTIATLLFWSLVEPVYLLSDPAESIGVNPNSPEAAMFSLSSMFLHWTVTPYAIYTVPAVVFAFVYYNMRKPYSLSSLLIPVLGEKTAQGKAGTIVDIVSLYTLALGMAASMGTNILNLSGGIQYYTGVESTPFLWAVIAAVVTLTFVISSSTGLMNGIRTLSNVNMKIFVVMMVFLFLLGPTQYILNAGTEAFGTFASNFFQMSLFTGEMEGDPWPGDWTTFYWASWFAWALITSIFLGRIAYGYKIKTMILVNFVLPAFFGVIWISIFSGTAIYLDLWDNRLTETLIESGPQAVVYEVFGSLPFASLLIPFYIFITFITFVTACDSNNSAMSGISSTGISPETPEPSAVIKMIWGVTISMISWIMISFADIGGVKMLNNLGGLPSLVLGIFVLGSLFNIAMSPEKYDRFKNMS
ncbi:BCCT family transporter [Salibacterium aidingense]|uniref:BCCT family transporter n=1 Tax=Salibacterium aidingense TaxID=384933 RepID=UPI003BE84379